MKKLAVVIALVISLALTACSSNTEVKLEKTPKTVGLNHSVQKESIECQENLTNEDLQNKDLQYQDLQNLIRRIPSDEIKHKKNER